MKLSFSLNAKPKQPTAGPSTNGPTLKKPAAFAALEEDEYNGSHSIEKLDAAPTFGDTRDTAANKRLLAQSAGAGTSRLQKKRMEAERAVDSSVYEYDAVYDQMQAAKERAKETKATQGKDRKVRELRLLHNNV
jgi:coiled-coil domain-containing protein 55